MAASETGDDGSSFDALLRQAARVSHPGEPLTRSPWPSVSTLLGGRLVLVRPIGEGGMGVVYEAFDAERQALLALKTLNRLSAGGVYRLKNEFRALAGVRHPNLVRLHDLFADGERWFFTMELVRGERFDRWIRPPERAGTLDEARLRSALPQLLAGLEAIHGAGKLHRDLKPSNVLVTAEGKVVLLDFGLAADPEPGGVGQTLNEEIRSGTPAYMAPEQAAEQAASRASDHYALGVMLFEALTGRLPFLGKTHEMLTDKQRSPAPVVLSCNPGAPADLAACCDALLQREPSGRPDALALRTWFGAAGAGPAASSSGTAPALPGGASHVNAREPLIGRDGELARLRAEYRAAHAGQPVVAFVFGESGIGKSALVAQFLAELRAQGVAAVVAGGCHERESVPFKGFDSLIDDLSRMLRKLPGEEVAALLPRDVHALARIFPVLARVDAVARAPNKDIRDPQELRQRAFAAFVELGARLRDRRPVVLHIDDAQWLDGDALTFLDFLLGQHDLPPVLLILSHRSAGAANDPPLVRLRRRVHENGRLRCLELVLGPLPPEATFALARQLLGDVEAARCEQVAVQSRGSPFLVAELARRARSSSATAVSLQDALLAHVCAHGELARQLIEVLAVAARPLPLRLALRAASADHEQLDALLDARLVASHGAGEQRALSCYHDKIRESVTAALAPERTRAVHGSLLSALLAQGEGDDEHIALHAEGAGERALAAHHAAVAGHAAREAMAFERAAAHYRRALELGEHDEDARRDLLVRQGEALAYVGRGEQAAEAFLAAARGASREVAFDLQRRAAEQWLVIGRADQGKALLAEVLREVGLRLPSSPKHGLFTAVWEGIRLKLRGTAFQPRSDALPAATARELAALLSSSHLAAYDVFTGSALGSRYARRALDSGDPEHAAIGLGVVVSSLAIERGAAAAASITALCERADALALASGSHAALARCRFRDAAAAMFMGAEAPLVLAKCEAALELLSEVPEASLQRSVLLSVQCETSFWWGRLIPAAELAQFVDDAFRRGNFHCAVSMVNAGAVARLCQDDHAGLARHLEQARRGWQRPRDYSFVDFMLMNAEMLLAAYRGDPAWALERTLSDWPAIERAELLRAPLLRFAIVGRRAVVAFQTLVADPSRLSALQPMIRRDVRSLERSHPPGMAGVMQLLLATLALVEDRMGAAVAHLRAAASECERVGRRTHASSARLQLGRLLGGDEGAELQQHAERELRAMGIVDLAASMRVV